MECQSSDVGLVSFQFKFCRCDWKEAVFGGRVCWTFLGRSFGSLLQVLDLLFEVDYLFLQCEDGLPLDFQLIPFGIDIGKTDAYLLREFLGSGCEVVLDEIFENVLVELRTLGITQHQI